MRLIDPIELKRSIAVAILTEKLIETTLDKIIDEQPTIEERKKGKWIDIDSEIYTWKVRCDKCGYERSMMSTQGKYPKFCEECGAKIEGVENG